MSEQSPKEVFNNCAKQYQDMFMDFDLYHDTINYFCSSLNNEKSSLLEIGCGPGNISKYIISSNPNFRLLGIDIAPNMIELAKKNVPSSTFKVMDSSVINSLKERFDGIICGFIIPYLNKKEVNKLFKDLSTLINNNGIVYISTMENNYEKSRIIYSSTDPNIGVFTHYYNENFIGKQLVDNGFKILQTVRKDYPKAKDDSKDLIIIAKKLS